MDRYVFGYRSGQREVRDVGSVPTGPLSSEQAGGFTGAFIGMLAEGDRAMADFDRFDYRPLQAATPAANQNAAGKVQVQAALAPTPKFLPGSGFRCVVSFDDEVPKIVDVHTDTSVRHWGQTASDGVTQPVSEHELAAPERRTFQLRECAMS